MFSSFRQHEFRATGTTEPGPNERRGAAGADGVSIAPAAATPVRTSSLLALGADLRAYLEQPDQASIGDFAALVERLQGEFAMICGDASLSSAQHDSIAALFTDAQTREFTPSDIGQIEAVLRDLH